MSEERHPSPADETKRLYEEGEARTARAFEQLVARDSFGELLALMTDNVLALTKLGTGVFDLVLRNLRIAGRGDIVRLSRQLARTEDKLERVLQEVERIGDEQPAPTANGRSGSGSAGGSSRSRRTGSRSRSGGSS
jgi:hypothetical protein